MINRIILKYCKHLSDLPLSPLALDTMPHMFVFVEWNWKKQGACLFVYEKLKFLGSWILGSDLPWSPRFCVYQMKSAIITQTTSLTSPGDKQV